jgi:hypothetical protein
VESANPEAQKLVSIPTPEHLQNRNIIANHSDAFMKPLALCLLRGQGSRGTTISRSSVSRGLQGLSRSNGLESDHNLQALAINI